MRGLGIAILILLASVSALADPVLPNPVDCANFKQDKAGPAACDAAITAAVDPEIKSVLLFRRAYMLDATGKWENYLQALDDLTNAILVDPQNYDALQERAYVYNEIEEPAKAEADLDTQLALQPNQPGIFQERGLSRFMQGKLEGAFEDDDRLAELEPNTWRHVATRAYDLMWLGRFDEAAKGYEAAKALAQQTGDKNAIDTVEAGAQNLQRWLTADTRADVISVCINAKLEQDLRKDTFIGDCTEAFLKSTAGSQRADALTQRSIAGVPATNDMQDGLDDLRIALAFDPANPDRMFNLGSRLEGAGRPHQALKYLNESIALKPSFMAYSARASAEEDLGEDKPSFADAKKSFEMQPNEIALTVLGDLVLKDLHDEKSAREYWLAAYKLGDRDDGLKARLEKVGVSWPSPGDATGTTK
jgi:tetratricopeptide (TPR) repeat protein